MTVLRDALWMHMERSHFLPTLADVNDCVQQVLERRGAKRSESDGQRFLREMDEAKQDSAADRQNGAAMGCNCPACEGTGFHMSGSGDKRVIVNTRRGSCPACGGSGRVANTETLPPRGKAAAANERQEVLA